MCHTHGLGLVAKVQTTDNTTLDPLDWKPVEVVLPEGYYRVFSGASKPGDLFLNWTKIKQGEVCWEYLESNEAMVPKGLDATQVPVCVIRKGVPVEQPCARCGMEPRKFDYKYCDYCCSIILNELRDQ